MHLFAKFFERMLAAAGVAVYRGGALVHPRDVISVQRFAHDAGRKVIAAHIRE
jgi:hypothetical protein